ncbi:hypothetical protein BaRGS_00011226 [Batillaria attramentaria]|uniref:Uncharacterized protein n=1 Tax=Batillaria attramentaria TaxID=370345 RepID=A0ABD0LE19_9CAEN
MCTVCKVLRDVDLWSETSRNAVPVLEPANVTLRCGFTTDGESVTSLRCPRSDCIFDRRSLYCTSEARSPPCKYRTPNSFTFLPLPFYTGTTLRSTNNLPTASQGHHSLMATVHQAKVKVKAFPTASGAVTQGQQNGHH